MSETAQGGCRGEKAEEAGVCGAEDETTRSRSAHSPDDVFVLEFFQQTDFPDGRTRNALIFGFQSDLLERHDPVCLDVTSLVDNTICTY